MDSNSYKKTNNSIFNIPSSTLSSVSGWGLRRWWRGRRRRWTIQSDNDDNKTFLLMRLLVNGSPDWHGVEGEGEVGGEEKWGNIPFDVSVSEWKPRLTWGGEGGRGRGEEKWQEERRRKSQHKGKSIQNNWIIKQRFAEHVRGCSRGLITIIYWYKIYKAESCFDWTILTEFFSFSVSLSPPPGCNFNKQNKRKKEKRKKRKTKITI